MIKCDFLGLSKTVLSLTKLSVIIAPKRPKMELFLHIWAGTDQSSLSIYDTVLNRLRGLVGIKLFFTLQLLSHRRAIASLSLFYGYFPEKCSKEARSLLPPV